MEQHEIPRQITTFEFKLIGFMTLKQFIYLLVFFPIAYLVLSVFPIPYLNILLAAIIAFFGIALAFIPINDRPLDVFIKNFIKRVMLPTQFYYKKTDFQQAVLQAPQTQQIKQEVIKHEETKQKLFKYLFTRKKSDGIDQQIEIKRKENIKKALDMPIPKDLNINSGVVEHEASIKVDTSSNQTPQQQIKKPFLTGIVKNKKEVLLPGMLIYIKDQNNNVLRLLKSNQYGTFSSFNPLTSGIYDIEIKDPNQRHIFDRIKIDLKEENPKPFEFFSKELI